MKLTSNEKFSQCLTQTTILSALTWILTQRLRGGVGVDLFRTVLLVLRLINLD